MTENVFARTTTRDALISPSVYNLVIGATLAWGFGINWLMVKHVPLDIISGIHPFILIGAYLASCFFGVYLYTKSDNPMVSFVGYNFVVVPFGFIINMVVASYDPLIVQEAIRITGLVTLIMMILGTLFPAFFRKIAGALTIALIAVFVIEMVEVFIFNMHHGILDWIVALIFAGYIGYDWGRANSIPKTYDNAVDSAAALYMDIINLFLRLIRILGRR